MTTELITKADFRFPVDAKWRAPRAVADVGGGIIIATAQVSALPEHVFHALTTDEVERWRGDSDFYRMCAPDWADTQIEFKIFRDHGQSFLHFRHSNWCEDAKTFPHCSMGWAIFLLSLKEFVETGKGRPYPYDASEYVESSPID